MQHYLTRAHRQLVTAARTTVVAKASKVVQSTGKALVSSAAKKTGFLGPTLSGTGNTQKKV
jgi:hypothetical protein